MICKPIGRPAASKPQGSDSRRQAGQIDRDREDVRQVHLQRVGGLLADAKAVVGAVGVTITSQRSKARFEVAADQRAHLLRLQVVGVVVAGDSA